MPFVIPRVSVPEDYGTNSHTKSFEYDAEPDVDMLKDYRDWLKDELDMVNLVIETNKVPEE